MVVPRTPRRAAIAWATNPRYPSRVHMTNGSGLVSLCGFPATAVTHDRPHDLRVCPDCAMAYVEESFPIDNTVMRTAGDVEWFRRLPPGPYPMCHVEQEERDGPAVNDDTPGANRPDACAHRRTRVIRDGKPLDVQSDTPTR